jgi:cutinase
MQFNWRARAGIALAIGAVGVSLVAGTAAPAHAATEAKATTTSSTAASGCYWIMFVGARGSGETGPGTPGWTPPAENRSTPSNTGPDTYGVGAEVNSAFYRIWNDLGKKYGSFPVQVESVDYAANSVTTLLHAVNLYFSNLQVGVNWTMHLLTTEAAACPNEQLVLAGYSQGAMVMHRVIHNLEATPVGRKILARVDAAILIADGDQVRYDNELDFGTAGPGANGIGHLYTHWSHSSEAPFPASMTSRILRICTAHDPVCDATFRHELDISIHTSYTGITPLLQASDYAAARIERATTTDPGIGPVG